MNACEPTPILLANGYLPTITPLKASRKHYCSGGDCELAL